MRRKVSNKIGLIQNYLVLQYTIRAISISHSWVCVYNKKSTLTNRFSRLKSVKNIKRELYHWRIPEEFDWRHSILNIKSTTNMWNKHFLNMMVLPKCIQLINLIFEVSTLLLVFNTFDHRIYSLEKQLLDTGMYLSWMRF